MLDCNVTALTETKAFARTATAIQDTQMQRPASSDERYRAPALDKGLDILELLSLQPKGLTRAEIVKEMGRGPSEIYRMLERLVAREYVRRSSEGDRYELSMKMFMIANRHPPLRRITAEAVPLMDGFAIETGHSCHLVVAEQGGGLVIAQASPPETWEFKVRTGAVLDLLATGSGQALLAFQSPEVRAVTLELWRCPERVKPLAEVESHLAQVRAQGFRMGPSQQLDAVTDISVPIFGMSENAFAVLTCAFTHRLDQHGIQDKTAVRERLQAIAARLSIRQEG